MSLVNWQGSAIFGPGSEWFWSMAQFILVAATLVGIYYQLRAQRASTLYEQTGAWLRDYNDERFELDLLTALIEFEGRPVDSGLPRSASAPGGYFERLGYLVADGHLRPVDVWHHLRLEIGHWWALMAPYVRRDRISDENPTLLEWFEKLELEMQQLDRKLVGRQLGFDVSPEALGRWIDRYIARQRLHADAKAGILPTHRALVAQHVEA